MIPKAIQSLVWNSRYLEVGLYVVSSSDSVYAVVLFWSNTQFRLMFEQIKTLSKRNFVYKHQTTSFALWRFGILRTCTVKKEDEILPQLFHFNLIYFNQSVRRHYADKASTQPVDFFKMQSGGVGHLASSAKYMPLPRNPTSVREPPQSSTITFGNRSPLQSNKPVNYHHHLLIFIYKNAYIMYKIIYDPPTAKTPDAYR